MTAVQYSMVTACLLLAALLIWLEVKRQNKARLLWRIIASVSAAASLAFPAMPIAFHTAEGNMKNEAVLLTDGYSKDSVDAFLKQNRHAAVYTKDAYEQQHERYNLHVFGYGLSADEWQTMPASGIFFHPSKLGNGIISIGYKKQISSGETLAVQGRFNNTTNKKIKLALSGFGAGLDSVVIGPNQQQRFELNTIPKFIGRAVYDITAAVNTDTLEQEPLPFEVSPAKPLTILLLAAYPDFENKFLQNWLYENGYVVAARTTISRNKYSYAFFDTSKFPLDKITPGVLQPFDVLIADGAALAALSRQELFSIKNQVSDKGLGLVIKTDSTQAPAIFYNGNCAVAPSSNHNKQILSVQLPGKDTASALPAEDAAFIKVNSGAGALITDARKNVLACHALYGNGSLVFSTFRNSYYWMLSGDKKSYQLLWSSLIGEAAKKEKVNRQWSVQPAFPAVNQPVQLTAEAISDMPFRAAIDSSAVTYAAQPFLPFEWTGIYRPSNAGWQPLTSSGGDICWFYVFDKNDWRHARAWQRMNDTHNYALLNKKQPADAALNNKMSKKTVPAIYFFVVFMCCCIFLWIEKKLS
ncbi:hypothetical protein [Parafilimonas sp.]|uniref:hypothetical protein n=1 Tax=Parafilimonas sp. TaxID=1969739 RepID=UPI0039E2D5F1